MTRPTFSRPERGAASVHDSPRLLITRHHGTFESSGRSRMAAPTARLARGLPAMAATPPIADVAFRDFGCKEFLTPGVTQCFA